MQAISEIATALTSGAAVVLPAAERSGTALAKLIREQNVTHATLPPVLLADLPEDLAAADPDRRRRGLLPGDNGTLVAGPADDQTPMVRPRPRSAQP